jgi:hypothetical protein
MLNILHAKKTALVFALASITYGDHANASIIDVLWASGTSAYNEGISALGAGGTDDAVSYDPNNDGSLSWNINFWSEGSIDFGLYDVLVIGSSCLGGTSSVCNASNGFFNLGVQPQNNVLTAKTEIEEARGTRTFVSGQDADWHYLNDPSDSADARGFLVNAVNWAASGSGLGIVALTDGHRASVGGGWIADPNSFLASELGSARSVQDSNSVLIPETSIDFPVNEGLTSASLSNWGTSSHTSFNKAALNDSEWLSINDFGILGGPEAVTIVTSSTADGPTDGGNDDPVVSVNAASSLGWFGFLLFVLFRMNRFKA